jgi:hypothetical protein
MIIDNNRIVLCGKGRCCPILEKTETNYTLVDDYGGKVVLTPDELDLLSIAIEKFTSINNQNEQNNS